MSRYTIDVTWSMAPLVVVHAVHGAYIWSTAGWTHTHVGHGDALSTACRIAALATGRARTRGGNGVGGRRAELPRAGPHIWAHLALGRM